MRRFIVSMLCSVSASITSAQTPPSVPTSYQTLLPGQTIQRPILQGESQSFTVSVAKGAWYRVRVVPGNARIWLRVYTPDNGWAAELLVFGDSSHILVLSADTTGKYRIDVSAATADSGSTYSLGIDPYRSDQAIALQKSVDQASSWLARNAHPLRSLTAGTDISDLAPLKTILSGVRIVGLGEATHGTSEFFQARHRITEYLVREMGFRLFALETSQSAAHAINDFVLLWAW
jgi:erythromycin esterase